MHVTQSLIKEALKNDHCPKQLYYAFVEGRELINPSENMIIGRYFESELLGSCRGGEKQQPKYKKGGEKYSAYEECDTLIKFAKDVFEKIGLVVDIEKVQVELTADYLRGNIDLIAKDIQGEKEAIYDVKWTATDEGDRWNGWANIEDKIDAHIQAMHYIITYHKKHGLYPSFYFLIFGKNKWVRIIRIKATQEAIKVHEERIAYTASLIGSYEQSDWKGNGNFNKCIQCPFYEDCTDKQTVPDIETVLI